MEPNNVTDEFDDIDEADDLEAAAVLTDEDKAFLDKIAVANIPGVLQGMLAAHTVVGLGDPRGDDEAVSIALIRLYNAEDYLEARLSQP